MLGAVTLIKDIDIDDYRYSYYGIGFDKKKELFTFGNGFRRNVVIFGVDMSSSVHADNEKRYFDSW